MYIDANYVSHGFVRAANRTTTTFDPLGSAYVIAVTEGIDSAGTVVEQYVDANSVGHGRYEPLMARLPRSMLRTREPAQARELFLRPLM